MVTTKGWSFTAYDFSRDFKRDNVDKALSTLLKKTKLDVPVVVSITFLNIVSN